MITAVPALRATTVPALSTAATIESVLLQTVGTPTRALPCGSVAVTARLIVSPTDVAVSRAGVTPTQRTAASPPPTATESGPNFALIEWVYERIETNPAPAEITPAPHRQAWLIRPCGRRTGLRSGFGPATGPVLLHPVTERYSLLSSHLAIAVGSGSLCRGHLAYEDHAAPARARPVGGFRAPTAFGGSQYLNSYVGPRIQPQQLDRAGELRVLRPIIV